MTDKSDTTAERCPICGRPDVENCTAEVGCAVSGVSQTTKGVDDALGRLPPLWRVWQMTQADGDGSWHVQAVGRNGGSAFAMHSSLPAAISDVAAKAWEAENGKA